jgi:hypothetical protein
LIALHPVVKPAPQRAVQAVPARRCEANPIQLPGTFSRFASASKLSLLLHTSCNWSLRSQCVPASSIVRLLLRIDTEVKERGQKTHSFSAPRPSGQRGPLNPSPTHRARPGISPAVNPCRCEEQGLGVGIRCPSTLAQPDLWNGTLERQITARLASLNPALLEVVFCLGTFLCIIRVKGCIFIH